MALARVDCCHLAPSPAAKWPGSCHVSRVGGAASVSGQARGRPAWDQGLQMPVSRRQGHGQRRDERHVEMREAEEGGRLRGGGKRRFIATMAMTRMWRRGREDPEGTYRQRGTAWFRVRSSKQQAGSSKQQDPSDLSVLSSDYERLFSNLNEATLRHDPGSLASSVLLIAGTTVGAGILAIPAVTQDAGFLASTLTCITCWLYMVATGLLIAEVNVNTMCELGSGGVSLVSMAERTLGPTGVYLSCAAYIFIHYALLVAYTARSADIIANASGLPMWASALLLTSALGGLCFFGSQRTIGAVNGALVIGVVSSFSLLLLFASTGLHLDSLVKFNAAAVPASIPIIMLSFVYQNVVPVVATNLEGNLPRIRTSIVLGTAIPLLMFLLWDAVILGSLPPAPVADVAADVASAAAAVAAAASDPLMRLREGSGAVGPIVEVFSLLAIATSYIGFVLGLTDFLGDLLKLPSGRGRQPLPFLLTLLPPFFLALLNPDIFYRALDVAGTYGVLLLFGIVPASMAWAERYTDKCITPISKPLLPGGQFTLVAIIGGAVLVISTEAIESLGGLLGQLANTR